MTEFQKKNVQSLINAKNSNKKAIFEAITIGLNHDNVVAWNIVEVVMKKAEGFVVDICSRINDSINKGQKVKVSEKQAWCIVYAFVKLTDEQVTEWFEEMCSEAEAEAETEEQTEGNEVEGSAAEDVNVRVWSYSAERHLLNVHYGDGKQIRVKVHPSKMKDVFVARNKGDKAVERSLVNQLARSNSPAGYEKFDKFIDFEIQKNQMGL
jgi:hypothetical protein